MSRLQHRLLSPVLVLLTAAAINWSALDAQGLNAKLPVKLYGHRGFTLSEPENSLPAIKAAIEMGLAGTEIDLRTTRDGQLVLMHDEALDRTTTGRGRVQDTDRAQLAGLFLKDRSGRSTDRRIPPLEDALALLRQHPGFSFYFDTKDVDVERLADRIVAAGLDDRIGFFVADPMDVEIARAIKKKSQRLRLSVNLLTWWKIEGIPTFAVKALQADALFASEWFFPRGGFAEAKEAGAEVQVFLAGTDNLVERARRAASLGADVISSDRPDQLLPHVVSKPGSR